MYGGGASFREISYLFVDMGCFRECLKRLSLRYFNDPLALVCDHSFFRSTASKVFFYDAVPAKENGEDHTAYNQRIDQRMAEVGKLRLLDGCHVQLGDLRGKKAAQKKVDVMIAVDMLMHTFRRNMDNCTLLTGDSDFQPLLEALNREGMFTTLWHPAQAPADLMGAADSVRPLNLQTLGGGLRRAPGVPLLPAFNADIRPRLDKTDLADTVIDGRVYLLSENQRGYLIEHFDPKASATSHHAQDKDRNILVKAAEDIWGIELPKDFFS